MGKLMKDRTRASPLAASLRNWGLQLVDQDLAMWRTNSPALRPSNLSNRCSGQSTIGKESISPQEKYPEATHMFLYLRPSPSCETPFRYTSGNK